MTFSMRAHTHNAENVQELKKNSLNYSKSTYKTLLPKDCQM